MNALTQYADQIADIAAYAKKVGFNPETGNFDELMRNWNKMAYKRSIFIQDNKSEIMKAVKSIKH